jgi:hypothetical protein
MKISKLLITFILSSMLFTMTSTKASAEKLFLPFVYYFNKKIPKLICILSIIEYKL